MKPVRRRTRRGFTLFEVLVTVVMISILAAIAVPFTMSFFKGGRVAAAKSQILAIYNAVEMYSAEMGNLPGSIDQLVDKQYLSIDQIADDHWAFNMNLPETISAVSTARLPFFGGGRRVVYDISDGRFYGFGYPDEE